MASKSGPALRILTVSRGTSLRRRCWRRRSLALFAAIEATHGQAVGPFKLTFAAWKILIQLTCSASRARSSSSAMRLARGKNRREQQAIQSSRASSPAKSGQQSCAARSKAGVGTIAKSDSLSRSKANHYRRERLRGSEAQLEPIELDSTRGRRQEVRDRVVSQEIDPAGQLAASLRAATHQRPSKSDHPWRNC